MSFSSVGGKTQRYQSHSTSSNVGGRRISQSKHAYSNSDGLDKLAWERTLDGQGRKVVKERHRGRDEEVTREMFHNLDENDAARFDQEWGRAARHMGGGGGAAALLGGSHGRERRPMLESSYDRVGDSGSYRHAQPSQQDAYYGRRGSAQASSRVSSRASSRASSVGGSGGYLASSRSSRQAQGGGLMDID